MRKPLDLTGKRFDMLTVLERAENIGKRTQWVCRCDCGNVVVIKTETLKGKTKVKSCGCIYDRKDLVGMKFGRLIVTGKYETLNNRNYWKCQCDCGNTLIVSTDRLKNGHTQSCGCKRKEVLSAIKKSHGLCHSRIYKTWCGIKYRCYNKNSKSYIDYGFRGISVCEEWQEFEPFYEWAMANGYNDDLTIERIDVNGNYCPENCKWVSKKAQANNTRRNVFIEISGTKKTIKQWTDLMGWNYNKYIQRKYKGKEIFSDDEIYQLQEKIRSDNCV